MKRLNAPAFVFLSFAVVLVLPLAAVPQSAVPMLINYQGELRSPTTGEPVPDGSYDMIFKVFDVQSGGAALWQGTHSTANGNPVQVTNGIFSVILGSGTGNTLDTSVFDEPNRWLEIRVKAETLSPRHRITSAAYSMASGTAGALPVGTALVGAAPPGAPAFSATNTGTGEGLYGSASGNTAAGVYGYASNSGDVENYGGYFEAAGRSGAGVFGGASGAEGWGVYGEATGSSLAGAPFYPTGVFGTATDAGSQYNYGGYFKAAGKTGAGVYGEATGSSGTGVCGRASGTSGAGVRGEASYAGGATNYGGYFTAAGKTGAGVYGEATGASGSGVAGHAAGASGIGVYGTSALAGVWGESSAAEGWGVYGGASGGSAAAVYGYATNTADVVNVGGFFVAAGRRGTGVYAEGNASATAYAGHFEGNVYVNGTLTAVRKTFVQPHPTDASRQIVYVCLEGGENGVYVRGSGHLENGRAEIDLPEHFALVAGEGGLTAHVTPRDGNARGYLYVQEVRPGHIIVAEAGGTSNARFDYLVMGVRRAFEEHRAVQQNKLMKPDRQVSQEEYEGWMALPENRDMRKLLIENGTLTAGGKINHDTAASLGWELGPKTKADRLEKMSPTVPKMEREPQ